MIFKAEIKASVTNNQPLSPDEKNQWGERLGKLTSEQREQLFDALHQELILNGDLYHAQVYNPLPLMTFLFVLGFIATKGVHPNGFARACVNALFASSVSEAYQEYQEQSLSEIVENKWSFFSQLLLEQAEPAVCPH